MHTPDTKTDGNQLLYRIQLEAGINHRALDGRMELRLFGTYATRNDSSKSSHKLLGH